MYTKPLVLQNVESIDRAQISPRVRLYLLGSRLLGGGSRAPQLVSNFLWRLQSAWRAVWLGLLDADGLNEITRSYYMGVSASEADESNIRQGLWPWEATAIRDYFKDRKRVLVAGAGGGREVIALARLGHSVTAFDFSTHLTAACRRNLEKAGCTAQVLHAPPDQFPRRLDVYDALLIGRGCYHHIPGRRRRVGFLKEGRFWLNSGAPILISDFFTRPVDTRFYLRTQTIANFIRRLRDCRERLEPGDWLTNTMQHAFTRQEIEKEFSEAGILFEKFAASPFSAESHLAHAVGRVL